MPINLLPPDLLEKRGPQKAAEVIKNTTIVGFAIFFAALFGCFAYILIVSTQVKSSNTRQDQLKQSVSVLETAEQKMVLVRDRLIKAKQVLSNPSANKGVDSYETLQSTLPSSASLVEAEIVPDRTKTSHVLSSSSGLTNFMISLLSSDLYKNIKMDAFSYSPLAGYTISLDMTE